jgi:DNA polymerase I-like protein with 3'-5' exonuclease and polymerase domains
VARGSSRKGQIIEITSTALEEYIPVKYVVVGRGEWIDGMFEPAALEGIRQTRVNTSSDLHRVKEWLDKRKHHYLDTESTGGLNPLSPDARLLMLQMGNQELVFVIQPELIPEFKEHLEDPTYTHVVQNAVHDWKFIYAHYKIHINNIYCTMLSEQLLTSGRSNMPVNLAVISRRHPPHRIITKAVRSEFIEFQGKFTKEMVYYAVRDVVLLPDIVAAQTARLKEQEMLVVAQDEYNLVPVTGSMELGGVPFSVDVLRLALLYWEKRQRDLEEQILKAYDQRINAKGTEVGFLIPGMRFEFDVNSQTQKLTALRSLGLELDDVKRDTLENLDDPIAELLGEYSAALKINSTYGENMINRINPDTHRLQVEFNQLGHGDSEAKVGRTTTIATGRYSSDFQQLPKAMNRYDLVRDSELQQVQGMFATKIATLLKEAE